MLTSTSTHELAPHSREYSYKDVTSGIVFMTGIDRHPKIEPTDSVNQMLHNYTCS
jgi:hypothetical protein